MEGKPMAKFNNNFKRESRGARREEKRRKVQEQRAQKPSRPAKFEEAEAHVVNPLKPLTDRQGDLIGCLIADPLILVTGPAGTGKTYLTAAVAADQYRAGKVNKIVLSRPNVPSGPSLGFFPGTLEEKMAPWTIPFTETIKARIGNGAYEIAVKRGDIEVVPFETMRGRSFDRCFVILDEAQNSTIEQMFMLLTRQGEDSTLVVNGDIMQSDIRANSGLAEAIRLSRKYDIDAAHIHFSLDDIVRSDQCRAWVEAFHREKAA